MTEDRKIKLNGNLNLLISFSTLLTLLGFAVWLGQKMERLQNHLDTDWNAAEMNVWTYRTAQMNTAWKPADPAAVHQEFRAK